MAVNESIPIINRLLAILILMISMWWISRTLKEGRKAVEEMKQERLNDHST
tara:strand:+ start:346 stop:498 length:153 start_codon:yes stop_codon:yes gene_type:complete